MEHCENVIYESADRAISLQKYLENSVHSTKWDLSLCTYIFHKESLVSIDTRFFLSLFSFSLKIKLILQFFHDQILVSFSVCLIMFLTRNHYIYRVLNRDLQNPSLDLRSWQETTAQPIIGTWDLKSGNWSSISNDSYEGTNNKSRATA
jgi:hypothetical protein